MSAIMQETGMGPIPRPNSSAACSDTDVRSAADELGLDRIGNLDIKIEGTEQKDYPDEKNVTTYRILITGPGGSHVVYRRYKEFEDLHESLFGQSSGHTEASAAAMPPKSFFRKTFMKKFRDQRQNQLGDVANAALMEAADADLDSCPIALRKFLGLDDTSWATWDEPVSAETATRSLEDTSKTEDPAAATTTASSSSSRATPADPEPEASNKEDRSNLLARLASKVENVVNKVEQKVENLMHGQKKEAVPAIYKVQDDGSGNPGLFYRKDKVLDDVAKDTGALTKKYQPWGTCAVGVVTSDGYLSVEFDDNAPVKTLYLPCSMGKKECLKLVEEPTPAYYRLHNTNLKINTADVHGILYRKSKDMKDKMSETIPGATQAWDSLAFGIDEGDGWLKVGDGNEAKYLPMKIDGSPVLSLKASKDKPAMQTGMLGCCAMCR
mmetsp:Transcript_127052/g.230713  ORF Transcript_127052/g.230713 Transcript_127052/m.230713 type:complete len:439 (-) Transcript_127052:217-1533(-)